MWSATENQEYNHRPTVENMVSFNVDPQWCGLLFSIYCRHEKASLTGGFPSPDALATCAFQGPPIDADWLALAGTLGFEICRLSDTWALVFESVKATSVIFLLGVGGLVCYKLYHYYWPRPRSPRTDSTPPSSPRSRRELFTARALDLNLSEEQHLLQPGDEPSYGSVQTRYFGPNNPLYEDDIGEGNPYLADQSASTSPSEDSTEDEGQEAHLPEGALADRTLQGARRQRTPWSTPHHARSLTWRRARHGPSSPLSAREHPQAMPADNPGWLLKRIGSVIHPVENQVPSSKPSPKKGASLPSTSGRRSRALAEARKSQTDYQLAEWKQNGRQTPEGAESSVRCGSIPRTSDTPPVPSPITAANFSGASAENSFLIRDVSLDSLGFSDYGGCDTSNRELPREGSFDSTCSELSIDFSLKETMETETMHCMEELQREIDKLKTNCLMMDEEFTTIICNRNLPGLSSLMKVSSDHHTQINQDETCAHNENSIDEEELKMKEDNTARACFAGLYSLTTIKNSTSSELSDSALMSYRHGSIGSAESLEWDSPKVVSPVKATTIVETVVSPVLDAAHTKLDETPRELKVVRETPPSNQARRERSSTQNSFLAMSEDELMANLEWDNEDMTQYPDVSGDLSADAEPNLIACVDTLEMDLETELGFKNDEGTPRNKSNDPESAVESTTSSRSCTASPLTERSLVEGNTSLSTSGTGGVVFKSQLQMKQSLLLPTLENNKPLPQWSSEESGFMEWDIAADGNKASQDVAQDFGSWADLSSATGSVSSSAQVSPDSEGAEGGALSLCSPTQEEQPSALLNIGHRAKLLQYAVTEWHGNTVKSETVLKGYAEIPSLLGLEHIRRIRGDNYCAIRAAIFQSLVQGVPVPSGHATFLRLSHAIDSGCQWLQDWQFAGRLPYAGNNVLHGMRVCLESLDNVASALLSSGDREGALAHMLNSDCALDLHVVEAVKLHMLACAMQLYDANCTGAQDVPLFAVLMFARDTSETPRDLMNNHLQPVGNTGGLEQVEMFLLGYALGVMVRVVRPLAFGTDDFVCNFPDWSEEDKCPQVVLIAEDDRHYNVLL